MQTLLAAPNVRAGSLIARGAVVVLFALAVVILRPGNAFAHAELVSSNPAPNSVLATPVTKIDVTFNEPVILFGKGIVVANGDRKYPTTASIGGKVVTAFLASPLGGGTYDVTMYVKGKDGHEVTPSFSFSIAATVVVPSTAVTPGTDSSSTTSSASSASTSTPETSTTTTSASTTSKPTSSAKGVPSLAIYAAIGAGVVVLALAIRGVIVLIRRRRS
ncbi:MAG: copper resistance CopC family protein [Acidimicrobiia bacterium]